MTPILALCAALAVPSAASEAGRVALLTDFQGSVYVRRGGVGANLPAKKDLELGEGDLVRTGPKSMAEVVMDGDAVLLVQPDSEFTVGSLSRSRTFLSMTLGTMLGKLKGLRKNESLQVRTLTAVCAVRGTEFGVEASSAATVAGIFEEGSMEVSAPDGSGTVTLGRNQETDVSAGGAPLPPRALKAFEFHRHRMAQIRRRFSRIQEDWRRRNEQQRKGLKRRLDRYRGFKGKAAPKKEEGQAEQGQAAEEAPSPGEAIAPSEDEAVEAEKSMENNENPGK